MCRMIRSGADLKEEFKKLCAQSGVTVGPRELSPQQKYYLGALDGQASSRVAELILKKVRRPVGVSI